MNMAQQYVPDWIRKTSDVWAAMGTQDEAAAMGGTQDEAAAADADAACAKHGFPVCDLDCADGQRYYRVITHWCVPLPAVLALSWRFATVWFQLPKETRADLLDRSGAYTEELGGGSAMEMVARLDAPELLQHVSYSEIMAVCGTEFCALYYTKFDAARCVRYLMKRVHHWGAADLAVTAATCGALNVLKDLFADSRGEEEEDVRVWIGRLWRKTIEGGHLHVLQWLHSQKPPEARRFYMDDFCRAARRGHWPVLAWMRAQEDAAAGPQAYCAAACMCEAVRGGHLHIVQRLRQEGCPWEDPVSGRDNVCREAARCGQFEVLRWAKANGCPWNQGHLFCIVNNNPNINNNNNKRMYDWIAAGGPPIKEEQQQEEEEERRAKKVFSSSAPQS